MNYAYTYDDIQIIPKYSEVQSRSECNLKTRFTRNYKIQIPLVSSPMDTVTESEMATAIYSYGGVGIVHRFMTIDQQCYEISEIEEATNLMGKEKHVANIDKIKQIVNGEFTPIAAAIGATGDYKDRAIELVNAGANVLLIDVAHGNTKQVRDAITWCKENLESHVDIIAGNVATYEGAKNLAEWGADAIRVGIGNGCFTPEMQVKTTSGLKKIIDIEIGDCVYTHTGEIHEVINKFEYEKNEEIVIINGIESTTNHEFYVIHKSVIDSINDDNIHLYAQWIAAGELTDEYFLIELE